MDETEPLQGGYGCCPILEGPDERNLAKLDDPQQVGGGARRVDGMLVAKPLPSVEEGAPQKRSCKIP